METKLLILLFFILCTPALSNLSFESPFTCKFGSFKLPKHLLEGKQLKDLNKMIPVSEECGDYEELKHVRRGQKGKGVYGGDVGKRPRKKAHSGASSLLTLPSSLISFTMVQVSIGLLLAFLYF